MKRLYKLPLLVAVPLLLVFALSGATATVPPVSNLQHEGALANERQLPVLLFFASTICGYCDQLEEDFLQPMLLSGDYEDKVIIRKLIIDQGSTIKDFDGNTVMAGKLSDRYKVFVTPTMLFIDGKGRELAERMVGINTPELFGGYLEDCIDTALQQIRQPQDPLSSNSCRLQHPADSPAIFKTAVP